ncbi:MAG: class I SAM-dependent methyltransferase [Planctomycetota bacterium]
MSGKKFLKKAARLVIGKEKAEAAFHEPAPREKLHAFWRNPDGENQPEGYLGAGPGRTKFLLSIVPRYLDKQSTILEVGCNAGRNLKGLHEAGYTRLSAIEINPAAVALFKQSLPQVAKTTTIHNAPVEEVIKTFKPRSFDGIYTMAVLEHIHPDSDWIFAEMARVVNKALITIEDERNRAFANIPRNYQQVFEKHGLKQAEVIDCRDVEGLCEGFYARVFTPR